MAEEIDDLRKALDALKSEHQKLSLELTGAQEDLKEYRTYVRDQQREHKGLKEALDAATAERDSFKAAAEADPDGLKAKLAEITGKYRERTHRDQFAEVARAHKVSDPGRVADLYALSGYKPEGDEADKAKLEELIGGALKTRPHFLDPPPAEPAKHGAPAPANGAPPAPPRAGPGAERGVSTGPAETTTQVRERIPGRI
jgi:hypothetical protein